MSSDFSPPTAAPPWHGAVWGAVATSAGSAGGKVTTALTAYRTAGGASRGTARFFAGLDLAEPGLVQVHRWRPDPDDLAPEGVVSAHGAVGRKPDA